MLKVPCKDCEERYVGCHSKCAQYKHFKQENEKKNKFVQEKNQQISDSLFKQKEHYKKKYY